MLVMANENGDWIEVREGSSFFFLDTDSDNFKEYLREEEVSSVEEWLTGDKLENDIQEYGKEYILGFTDGGSPYIDSKAIYGTY